MDVASLSVLPVGVVPWRQPEPAVTVVVKATFSLGRDGEAPLATEQEPLGLDEPYPAPDGAELWAASDFAPLKARADVLVVGHLHGGVPARQLGGRFSVDQLERNFVATAAESSVALPLTSRCLRATEGGDPAPFQLAPRPSPAGPWWGHHADQPVDFSAFNVAPAAQQIDRIRPTALLELENLLPGVEYRKARLPGLRPTCFYLPMRDATGREAPRPDLAREVALRCDTLWIDTDRALCTLSWRGVLVLPPSRESTECLLVGIQQEGPSVPFVELAADLPSARWVRAVEPGAPLVPPGWVRPTAASRSPAGSTMVRAAAAPPRQDRSVGLVTATAVTSRVPVERFPFLPGPDHDDEHIEPPTVIREEAPPTRGATGVIDREALLRARALPFDPARDAATGRGSSGQPSAPLGLGVQLGVSKLGQPAAPPGAPTTISEETTTVGPRPAPRSPGRHTQLVESAGARRGDSLPFTRAILDESLTAPRVGGTESRGALPRTAPLPVFPDPSPQAASPLPPPAERPWPSAPQPPGLAVGYRAPPQPGHPAAPLPPLPRAEIGAAAPSGPLMPSPAPGSPSLAREPVARHAAAAERSTITLGTYARIKAEMWCSPKAMGEILERNGVDEALWLTYERHQEQALAEEASQGRSELASQLREALGRARAELSGAELPALSIEQYVELRVEVDCAPEVTNVLQARGLSVDQWHRLRRAWHERSLGDPALARELRAKLAAVRRARQA